MGEPGSQERDSPVPIGAIQEEVDPWTAETGQRHRRRLATVYDAVAGSISYSRALQEHGDDKSKLPSQPTRVLRQSTRDTPCAPDEVLFRRKDAPERYAEYDIYFSHERDLPHAGRGVLPESDLLKAVHGYTSKFYAALNAEKPQLDGRDVDERSMDETALLAFGFLLEEAGKELLGRRGHLVFTEEASHSPDPHRGDEMGLGSDQLNTREGAELGRHGPKRRKVAKSEDM